MPVQDRRPDPELLLRQWQAEERLAHRGKLKVFLGYSSGVGKTYTMLDEGRRRKERGQDVVLGAVQSSRSPEISRLLAHLEHIRPLSLNGREAMDVSAILRRRPQVCLVDPLAWENPPGARNAQRWQDVDELLDAGISVVGAINLQYIAEYREAVGQITGKLVTDSVPLAFIHSADEIEIVDAPTADAMVHTGDTGAGRAGQLKELRELTLLAVADAVDRQLEAYLERSGVPMQWGTQERILVCMTARSDAAQMIASGARNARRFHGELFAIYVEQPELTAADQAQLERNLQTAREGGATIRKLQGEDPVRVIMQFAAEHGVTQIFIGHTGRQGWWTRMTGTPVDRLIRLAENMDVQVFPH